MQTRWRFDRTRVAAALFSLTSYMYRYIAAVPLMLGLTCWNEQTAAYVWIRPDDTQCVMYLLKRTFRVSMEDYYAILLPPILLKHGGNGNAWGDSQVGGRGRQRGKHVDSIPCSSILHPRDNSVSGEKS